MATSDSPVGPFKALLSKPLLDGSWDYIDPSPWVDEDGSAYLVFGNPGCYIAKLNSNMTSFNTTWKIEGDHVKKTDKAGVWEFMQDEDLIEPLTVPSVRKSYFSVAGHRLSHPQKGINIQMMPDGGVKKVIR